MNGHTEHPDKPTNGDPAALVKIVNLSPADAEALDQLLDASSQSQATAADPRRLQQVERVLGLLNEYAADEPSRDLVQRTLARVSAARQRQQLAERVAAVGAAPIAFRWTELIGVAAVLMIGLSLIWPALEQMRGAARRVACATELSQAGTGLNTYAADHAGMLPRGKVERNSTWWNVGEQSDPDAPVKSNSANLYRLITFQYVHPATLACPENPNAAKTTRPGQTDWDEPQESSFSFQNMFAPKPLRIDAVPRLNVLADKSPLFTGSLYQRDILSTSPSEQHNRVGQNILRIDGGVDWTNDPVIDGDNIWLGEGVDPDKLEGTELPSKPGDAFLVP